MGFTFCPQLEGTQVTKGDVLIAGGGGGAPCGRGVPLEPLRASFRVGFLCLVELLWRHAHGQIWELVSSIHYQSSRGNSAE